MKRPELERRVAELAEAGGGAWVVASLVCGLVRDRDDLELRVERLERRLSAKLDRESRTAKGRRKP